MSDGFALHEGAFGRVEVLDIRNDLVPHSHSDTQFVFWLGGAEAEAKIGGESVRYSADTALGVNTFVAHDLTLLTKNTQSIYLCFYVTRDWLDERRKATGRAFTFASPRVPIDANLRRACWRVLDLLISAHESSAEVDKEVETLLEIAMSASSAQWIRTHPTNNSPILDHRLRRALSFMREHVTEKMHVDEVAAKVGLSRAHFFALFKDQLNTTPQVFWSAIKLEEATRRLLQNGESLTSMAIDLGFSAPGNFSRFFKEHRGVAPSAYRKVGSKQTVVGAITGLSRELES
jgi:AraC-like DNA-binding protein